MLVAGKFAWVPHVKLPVKYLWYSGKFTCARRQCACVLREVLAASKQVNLPVITGKLHVAQVNCARYLFTCELHVKLPAFAGKFARASFTVYTKGGSSSDFDQRFGSKYTHASPYLLAFSLSMQNKTVFWLPSSSVAIESLSYTFVFWRSSDGSCDGAYRRGVLNWSHRDCPDVSIFSCLKTQVVLILIMRPTSLI